MADRRVNKTGKDPAEHIAALCNPAALLQHMLLLSFPLTGFGCFQESHILAGDHSDTLDPGPVTASGVWFGGDREPAEELRAGGVVPVWFRAGGPAPDPDVTVTVRISSGEDSADVSLRSMRVLTDAELCEISASAGGAIVVFQEEDGSDPTPATADAVRQELLSLGLTARMDFPDGMSALLPGDPEVVGTVRRHPNVRSVRPLPFPSWPAVLIEPELAATPANWYKWERWGMVGTAAGGSGSGCGHSPAAEVTADVGDMLDVRYRQPDGGSVGDTASVVQRFPEPNVDACLATVDELEIDDVESTSVDIPDPGSLPPWYTHDAALAAWFSEGNGQGSVMFKEPESPRTLETGIRSAVSASTLREGLEMVCRSGAYRIRFNQSIGGASVKISPGVTPSMRSNPIVDVIEPSVRTGPGPGDIRLSSPVPS